MLSLLWLVFQCRNIATVAWSLDIFRCCRRPGKVKDEHQRGIQPYFGFRAFRSTPSSNNPPQSAPTQLKGMSIPVYDRLSLCGRGSFLDTAEAGACFRDQSCLRSPHVRVRLWHLLRMAPRVWFSRATARGKCHGTSFGLGLRFLWFWSLWLLLSSGLAFRVSGLVRVIINRKAITVLI